jgi:hypothetical protein
MLSGAIMTKGETRLQSPAVQAAMNDLEDLQGQVLADAAFQRKVAALKRRAQREILASFGKALEAFSGHWRALDARHSAERERFSIREASVHGRVLNSLTGMPLTGLQSAASHVIKALGSREARERALVRAHQDERGALAMRQRVYRQSLSRPHQTALRC